MKIKSVDFVGSFTKNKDCPNVDIPEYAFIGRSNVGKSSLINYLCDRKKIAKVSNTPGKTQLINFFNINDSWHLVDLPGYGYAQVAKSERKAWEKMIKTYLSDREYLMCTFVLLDSRIPLQKIDLEFINWMGENGIPFVIIYTKIDGIKRRFRGKTIRNLQNSLLEYWSELPDQFVTTSTEREGREEVLDFIALNNKKYEQ